MKRICVFTGSNVGNDKIFHETARLLGLALAQNQIGLVYGGASVGLMGILADAVLEQGAHVIGVLPRDFEKFEVTHNGLSELRLVDGMHERKALMAELSDGFIAMPGGLGTLEEIFEVYTWAQLGFHDKPLGFLNVAHYYDNLFCFLDHVVSEGFMKESHRRLIHISADPNEMITKLRNHEPIHEKKWIGK